MDILFSCPKCGGHLSVEHGCAGMEMDCGNCGRMVRVPQHSTLPRRHSSIERRLYELVGPLSMRECTPRGIYGLGPDAVKHLMTIFENPVEPESGLECNQWLMAAALYLFAHEGNQDASSFLERISREEFPLYGMTGHAAFELAKEYVQQQNLDAAVEDNWGAVPGMGKVNYKHKVKLLYPDWMSCPEGADEISVEHNVEVLPAGQLYCPQCFKLFPDLETSRRRALAQYHYGLKDIADGAQQSFAQLWWTPVSCCNTDYLICVWLSAYKYARRMTEMVIE